MDKQRILSFLQSNEVRFKKRAAGTLSSRSVSSVWVNTYGCSDGQSWLPADPAFLGHDQSTDYWLGVEVDVDGYLEDEGLTASDLVSLTLSIAPSSGWVPFLLYTAGGTYLGSEADLVSGGSIQLDVLPIYQNAGFVSLLFFPTDSLAGLAEIGSASCSLTRVVAPDDPLAMRVATLPGRTSYLAGEVFDPDGMSVEVRFSRTGWRAVSDYSCPSTPLSVSDSSVTITRGSLVAQVAVTVYGPAHFSPRGDEGLWRPIGPTEINLSSGRAKTRVPLLAMGKRSYRVELGVLLLPSLESPFATLFRSVGLGAKLDLEQFVFKVASQTAPEWRWVDADGEVHSFALFDQAGSRYFDKADPAVVLRELPNGCEVVSDAGGRLLFDSAGRLCEVGSLSCPESRKVIVRNQAGLIALVYDARKVRGNSKDECLIFEYQSHRLSRVYRERFSRDYMERADLVYGEDGRLSGVETWKCQAGAWAKALERKMSYDSAGRLLHVAESATRSACLLRWGEGRIAGASVGTVGGSGPLDSLSAIDPFFVEDGRMDFSPQDGREADVIDERGVTLRYQWDTRNRISSVFEVVEESGSVAGLRSLARPRGYPVSQIDCAGGALGLPVDGEGAFFSGTLGFSMNFDFSREEVGSNQYFTLEFYLRHSYQNSSGMFLEAYYPENDHAFQHTERTRAEVNHLAAGAWQRVRLPIRFDTGLQREPSHTPSVSVVLWGPNSERYAFDFTRPRVLESDQRDFSIKAEGGAVLADAYSIIGYESSLRIEFDSGASSGSGALALGDVVRAVGCPLRQADGTYDLIAEGGTRRLSGVSGVYAQPGASAANLLSLTGEWPKASASSKSTAARTWVRTEAAFSLLESGGSILYKVVRSEYDMNEYGEDVTPARFSETMVYDRYGRLLSEEAAPSRPKRTYQRTAFGDAFKTLIEDPLPFDAYKAYYAVPGPDGLEPAEPVLGVGGELISSEEDSLGQPTSYSYEDGEVSEIEQGGMNTLLGRDLLGRQTSYSFHGAESGEAASSAAGFPNPFTVTLSAEGVGRSVVHSLSANSISYFVGSDIKETVSLGNDHEARSYFREVGLDPSDSLRLEFDERTGRPLSESYNGVEKVAYFYRTDGSYLEDDGPIRVQDSYSGRVTTYERDVYGGATKVQEGPFLVEGGPSAKGGRYRYDDEQLGIWLDQSVSTEAVGGRPTETTYVVASNTMDPRQFMSSYDYYPGSDRLKSVTTGQFHKLSFTYEAAPGLIDSASYENTNLETGYSEVYQHRPDGRLIGITRSDGIVSGFDYDWAGRLESETHSGGACSAKEIVYSYEGLRIDKVSVNGVVHKHHYDSEGRLNSITLGPSDEGPQVAGFSYDRFGNLTSKADEHGTVNYTYTRGNLLSSAGGHAFAYDHAGRRVRKDGIEYYYDGDRLIMEVAGSDWRLYIYDALGPCAMYHGQDFYYFVRNALGDVVGVAEDGGGIVARFAYDAFGSLLPDGCWTAPGKPSGFADLFPFRYRGYYYDHETGLYLCGSRYYDPAIRRFITPDDPGYLDPSSVGGLDPYCYCNNDPVTYTDATGHMPEWAYWLIGGLVIAGSIALTVATGGTAWPVLAGAVVGGATGTFFGGADFSNGFSWDWEGAAKGFAWGSASGAVSGAVGMGVSAYLSASGITGFSAASLRVLLNGASSLVINGFEAMIEHERWTLARAGASFLLGGFGSLFGKGIPSSTAWGIGFSLAEGSLGELFDYLGLSAVLNFDLSRRRFAW